MSGKINSSCLDWILKMSSFSAALIFTFLVPFVVFHLDPYRVDLGQSFALRVGIWKGLWAIHLQQRKTRAPQSEWREWNRKPHPALLNI